MAQLGALAPNKQTNYTKLLDVSAVYPGHLQGVTSHNIVTTYAYIEDLVTIVFLLHYILQMYIFSKLPMTSCHIFCTHRSTV